MLEELLNRYGLEIVRELRDNMQKKKLNNTGKTSRSIRYEVLEDDKGASLTILGEEHLIALNDGAKAITKRTNGKFIEAIQKWAQQKLNLSAQEAKGLAFGYLKNRTGGGPGLTTNKKGDYLVPNRFNSGGVLEDTLNRGLVTRIGNEISKEFANSLIDSFRVFNNGIDNN